MDFVIGEEIKKRVRKKGLKNKAFADLMNMEERNLYHFFKKEVMDVDQLLEAGKILDFDFLTLYIKNSKFKDYIADLGNPVAIQSSSEHIEQYNRENQISFSLTVQGSFDVVSSEMSNFLQSIKKEAEERGMRLV